MSNVGDNSLVYAAYMQAKQAEKEAKERRIELECQMAEIFNRQFPEDKLQKTFHDGIYQIKIKRNIRIECTPEGWEVISKMPKGQRPVVEKLDETKAKKIEGLREFLNFIETKPSFEVVIME